jgi:hypothetical protein
MQPVRGVAVCWLLNQTFADIGHFYHFHVNINKLRERTLNFGLIANLFYSVVLELLGGFAMPRRLIFVEFSRLALVLVAARSSRPIRFQAGPWDKPRTADGLTTPLML